MKRFGRSFALAVMWIALAATPVRAIWVPGGNERYCACYCGWWSVFMCHLGGIPQCAPGPYPQCDLNE